VGRHPSATPPDPAAPRNPPLALAPGVELLGEYLGSGSKEAAYLVRRPDGRMLRMSLLLYMVAGGLDGDRDLDEIAGRIAGDLGRPVSAASVAYLIDRKLRPLGMMATGGTETLLPPGPAPALGLAVRAGVVPIRAVMAATAVLRPLFLPPVVGAALIGWAVVDALFLVHPGLRGELHGLVMTPPLLLAVLGVTLAAALFHEFGHATASRYGGAAPGVIGVGIYLLWPVFYNDLNDVYRLDRRGRLRADLGGLYFNVLVVLALAAAYAASGWPPLLAAAAIQHVAMAQQLLPFIRLDGYYVVSDLVGVPDLFGRIRPMLAGMVPGRRRGPKPDELRRGARAIVTAWVLVTVPLLAGCVALAVVALPSILATSARALRSDGGVFVSALRAGSLAAALLSAVQAAVLAVPLVGVAVALVRATRIAGRRTATARRRAQPVALAAAPPPSPVRRPGGMGAALVLVLLCAGAGRALIPRWAPPPPRPWKRRLPGSRRR
jgi:putative peptide zinc metalloprotease protein